MSRLDRIMRHRDPIDHFCGSLGAGIRAHIAKTKPDVVHFAGHLPAAAIASEPDAVPFTLAMDVTRVAMERDVPRNVWTRFDLERDASLALAAQHLFPMSTWIADSLSKDCAVPADRVTVMPPSVVVPRALPLRGGGQEKLQIIFIGNDFQRKGGDLLCEWIAGPLAKLAELHVVSADPKAKGDIAGVTFHGRVPNEKLLTEVLPRMDVFCLPTRSDMSPQVLAEAAAAGLPSVSSNIGGIPDLVENGVTGHLVDPKDNDGFVRALSDMSTDRDKTREMGMAAWERARALLNAEINFDILIDRLIVVAQDRKGT